MSKKQKYNVYNVHVQHKGFEKTKTDQILTSH